MKLTRGHLYDLLIGLRSQADWLGSLGRTHGAPFFGVSEFFFYSPIGLQFIELHPIIPSHRIIRPLVLVAHVSWLEGVSVNAQHKQGHFTHQVVPPGFFVEQQWIW